MIKCIENLHSYIVQGVSAMFLKIFQVAQEEVLKIFHQVGKCMQK